MAVGICLSPVPTTPAALEAARNYLAHIIGAEPGPAVNGQLMDPDAEARRIARVDAMMAAASALVEREAPAAPQSVKNESVVRMAGYMWGSDFGGIVSETSVGSRAVEYVTNHAGAFRRSGAKALLSPWKRRRARSIG